MIERAVLEEEHDDVIDRRVTTVRYLLAVEDVREDGARGQAEGDERQREQA
jgi:hypothetical protein